MDETAIADKAGEWVATLKTLAAAYGLKVIGALAILVIGRWIAGLIRGVVRRMISKRDVDPIITSFIVNLCYIGLLAFVVIAALQTAGIPTTSFVAVLGAAGLAIGLALQGSLSNFAAGFMLIIFRPFKKGDYVEAGGTAGVVQEIQVFTTVLNTPDNKRVIVPNSAIMGGNITNFSALDTRRVDWVFGVSYGDDIDKVKATIRRVVEADARILKDPPIMIVLSAMADSSVNFTTRAWVKSPDYWPTFFAINEAMKKAFDAEDITIPFPQRDIHLFQEGK
ncbi:MAG TPA: mechanosensitive ion channel protein [Verrucomicrobiales bacterium]|nr:mechanosensitive ion channel protein [Verrucomicrobiales bacterium]